MLGVTLFCLVFVIGWQLMCLSDLEFDYINPFDSSSRINSFIIPEFLIHGALSCVYLLTGHWLLFLLNVPLTYYHVNLWVHSFSSLSDIVLCGMNEICLENLIRFYVEIDLFLECEKNSLWNEGEKPTVCDRCRRPLDSWPPRDLVQEPFLRLILDVRALILV